MPKLPGPLILVAAFGGFFLVLLLVFQVLDTEFFRGDPDLGGSAVAVKNAKTLAAHRECAREARTEASPETDYTAWDLGFERYLVKVQARGAAKPYLCRIANPGGAETWTVQSLEFLE